MSRNWQKILENFLIPDEDRSAYTKEAEDIQNFVLKELKSVDERFDNAFDGLNLEGKTHLERIIYNINIFTPWYRKLLKWRQAGSAR